MILIEVDIGRLQWWRNRPGTPLLIHRVYGPAREWWNGTKCWFLNGKSHREGGPAIESRDGTLYYFVHGVLMSKVIRSNINRQEAQVLVRSVTIIESEHGIGRSY